jgi:hypothetical protein
VPHQPIWSWLRLNDNALSVVENDCDVLSRAGSDERLVAEHDHDRGERPQPLADEVAIRYRHRPTTRSPILKRKLPGPN